MLRIARYFSSVIILCFISLSVATTNAQYTQYQQCPNGRCPQIAAIPASPTAPRPPTTYQLSDSTGQAWQHTDAAWLTSWVAKRNEELSAKGDKSAKGIPLPTPSTPPVLPNTLPIASQAPQATQQVAAQATYGDPYGFTSWLNRYRASAGLGPVAHDTNLSAWAASNNAQQHARGLGHHVFGSARRQNSGMGAGGTVWQAWTASPPHQSALLDPSITNIGIAFDGSYWTYSAY